MGSRAAVGELGRLASAVCAEARRERQLTEPRAQNLPLGTRFAYQVGKAMDVIGQ